MFNKKNEQKSPGLTRLVVKDVSKIIETKHLFNVGTLLPELLQKLASFNFSKLSSGVKIADFIGKIRAAYQELILVVDQHLGSARNNLHVNEEEARYEAEQEAIENQVNEKKTERSIQVGESDEMAKKLKSTIVRWKWLLLPLWILAGFELLANFRVFVILGGSVLSSFAIGALASLFTFFWAHFSPERVQRYGGEVRWKRMLWFAIFSAPPILLFTGFATMRLKYMLLMNPEVAENLHLNPLTYVVINYLAYVVSYFIVDAYKPSKADRNRYNNYKSQLKEIEKINKEISTLQAESAKLKAEWNQKKDDRRDLLLLANQLEEEVVTKYHEAFAELKTDLIFKTAGEAGVLFTNDEKDIPPLRLNYDHIGEELKRNRKKSFGKVVTGLTILLSTLSGCSHSTIDCTTDYHIYAKDVTDSFATDKDSFPPNEVGGWLLPEQKGVGVVFELTHISDRRYTGRTSVQLKQVDNDLLLDEVARKTEKDRFVVKATNVLNSSLHQPVGKEESYVLSSLTDNINVLAGKTDARTRNLYVSGDLIERTDDLNWYNTDNLALLKHDPDSMFRYMDENYPLHGTVDKNIHIHFVFSQAKSNKVDFAFHRISGFLRDYYRTKGVTVSIHPSLRHALSSRR
ncbi:MAG: hypothetical protein JJ975_12785 [Bacteroidia bacterium]|nr:hypothetical protein [Bacteroidia bacterium]